MTQRTITYDETKWKLVPLNPTEEQWGGIARAIIMAWDFGQKTPRQLFEHLRHSGHKVPDWMSDEMEMHQPDHVPSKGTRATLIYKAFLNDAPTPPADGQVHPRNVGVDVSNAHTIANFVHNSAPGAGPIEALHQVIDTIASHAQQDTNRAAKDLCRD